MKPRTKIHHRIVELSSYLPRITEPQKDWAYKNCLPHLGYANKTSAFCLDCGETFSLDLIKRNKATCPNCQTKLTIKKTQKRTVEFINYFAITHVVEEFQVVENFELKAYHKKGQPVEYFLQAILEDWINPELKVQKIGLLHHAQGYCDSWTGGWEIRIENGNYWNRGKYDVYPRMYHPDSVFKDEYAKYGINKNLNGLSFLEAAKLVPNYPHAETLLKSKQYSLLSRFSDHSGDVRRYWNSIKICIRNNYKVKDAGVYIDYLELLNYFNKDLLNAKYVCPKNLKKEHDHLVAKKRIIQKRQEVEHQRKKIFESQKKYEEMKSAFFGLMFSDGEITVKVLENVQEFMEAGDALKHCLFTNEYYKKEDSLVLSAKIEEKPIETIEVSLSKMKIIQSRGFQNKASEYNERIVTLVKSNLKAIKSIVKNNTHYEISA